MNEEGTLPLLFIETERCIQYEISNYYTNRASVTLKSYNTCVQTAVSIYALLIVYAASESAGICRLTGAAATNC